MFLIIDNYDSFTYNLYQYIGEILKQHKRDEIQVFRNDEITVEEIRKINPKGIIISPGPGSPENSGITIEVIKNLGKEIPILGICLGHQAIAYCYGGEVLRANEIKHGKTSTIKHTEQGIFNGIKNPLKVMRYHSLIVSKDFYQEN
ncbi:anthranilate synthase component 2 [Clostridium tetanomorphum]|nr:anthranilate synthase component 2 [Clostridium tetanomorphum]